MPIAISFIYFINTIFSILGYDFPCLSIIAGTSIISIICKYYNVKEDSEDAAYLIGYIIKNMANFFTKHLKEI